MKKGWSSIRVGQVIVENPKSKLKVRDSVSDGKYPFYTSGVSVYSFDDFLCEGNNLFIATGGKACFQYYEGKAAYSTDCYSVTTSPEFAPKFLFYFLESILEDVESNMFEGAALRHLQKKKFKQITVPFPSLAEQQRIVALLDEAFAGLAAIITNAEKNLRNTRELFESHLHEVFTQRTEGWVEKSIGSLVVDGVLEKPFDGNHGEIHPKKSDYTESGVPFIMARDLRDGLVDTENCSFISRKLADSLRVGFAKNGDILISHKGTIGRSAILNIEDDYVMLTPQVTGYRVKDPSRLFNRFVRYYFMSPGFQREFIAGAADGSTRAYIGITKQLSLRFRFPSLAVQKQIASKLDDLSPEIQRLESIYSQKIAAMDELKKTLLHKAFAGEL